VSTAEKAREIAMYSRFPPVGKRGLGSPFAHGTWGLKMEEYVKAANDHVLVIVQIETKEGVQNIDKIVDVDGIGE
jgi:4-hydroxy-2-oxoheptanedioate aldolase